MCVPNEYAACLNDFILTAALIGHGVFTKNIIIILLYLIIFVHDA